MSTEKSPASPQASELSPRKAVLARAFTGINKGDLKPILTSAASHISKAAADIHASMIKAFPDMKVHVEDTIEEGDKVVTRWTFTGTHKGEGVHPVMGKIKPTNKRIKVSGITIHQIQDGKIVQTWGESNQLSALEQLGLLNQFATKSPQH